MADTTITHLNAGDSLRVIGHASQSANIIEVETNGGSLLFTVGPTGLGSLLGGQIVKKTNVSDTNYDPSALTEDYIIAFTSLTAARTCVISTEDKGTGTATQPRVFIIKDESGNCSPTNTITISLETAGNIDGSATFVLNAAYNSVTLYINGTNAFVM